VGAGGSEQRAIMSEVAGWSDPAADLDELDNEESEDQEQDQEDDLPGDEEQHPYPSDEYLALAESLRELHVANFSPQRLTDAVTAAGERRGRV